MQKFSDAAFVQLGKTIYFWTQIEIPTYRSYQFECEMNMFLFYWEVSSNSSFSGDAVEKNVQGGVSRKEIDQFHHFPSRFNIFLLNDGDRRSRG